ncbi:uncharacterized protein LOC102575965 isoform X1 [Alligator mississippiensis]|uniref:uncharacterized protein LOC102575965 isoform X1 n=1 Tax=Alligator mississippiensis TaxID=8496 RepID=UPI00090712B2|nr:uncharacterized protein LOC102575965 isoform X1 [Alligator mississippiensis]
MAAAAPTQQLREAFEDVALYFTRKEWELLGDGDKVLYRDQMLRNYHTLVSLGYQGPTPDLICRIQRGEVELWVCDDKDPGETAWSKNLSPDLSDSWDSLAEDSSVGSFPGPGSSVQAALSGSMSQRMSPLDPTKRAPNWSRGEVLDLIVIWGEVRRTVATAAKGTKGNRQNQAICERIAAQMVARGHQRDWLQVRTKIKSLKSLYVRGRDAKRVPGAAKNTIPFHKELADILERDHAVAPRYTVQCTASDQQEGDSGEAASSQQPPAAPQDSCEYLGSSVALILSPIAEPGMQETQEVAPGLNGCKSEVTEIEHPAGNLSDFSDAWDPLAEDSSVGSFPGPDPSVQAALSAGMSQRMPPLDSVRRAPNWSHSEVLDLITIWGEVRRAIATAAKGTKGNRQKQAVCERIAAQMMARGHQRDWLQVRTKIKSLKSLYVRGKDASRVPGAAKNTIPFHKELADILERDHIVAPYHTVRCTASGPVCYDQEEGDSGEAASSQQPPGAPQESCEDLVSSVALSPIAEPGTQEVAPGQDGCKSEVPEIEHPAGNLSGIREICNSFAEDSSVGSFPGSGPSVQAAHSGSVSQKIPTLDSVRRAPNWSRGEVLDLIAIWGEMRRTIAAAGKGTKGNRQKQAVCEMIAAQMVARGHQRDWLQVRTKIKSLKSLYVRGRGAKRVPGAAKNTIPFHKELADILERDHAVAPRYTVQRTALGPFCCDQQEGDRGEAASSQQPPVAPQESCEDLVSSVALILSPIAEPGTRETQEVAPGQDGCKSEVPEIGHPAGNLSDFSDAWDSLADDSSVGSFPGPEPSVQADYLDSVNQRMPLLDPIKRAPNWSHGEVLDLIAIWGEMRRTIATAAKGTKGNRQKQAVCERIAAQMVAWGHQRDWLQVRTKIKSLKSLYVRGRDAKRVPGAAKNAVPFHKELADILEGDHIVAPCHTVQHTALGPVCCDQQEGDSGEAASSQQLPAAPQESCEDPVSSVALVLSPIAEPGTQETQEVAPGQDGCKSEVSEIEHPAGNLFDFSDAWDSLAEDSSVGSFPGSGPSVQAGSMSEKMPALDSVRRAPNWSRGEVLDLITAWGEMRRAIATAGKGSKGNRQKQAICERIAAQMVARGHQRDWLQVRTKIKSLKSLYVKGRDANKVPGAAKNTIPFHKELADILERDRAVAPRYTVQCTALGPFCCDQQEGDSGEAASSQQLPAALQERSEDLVSSVALILSPIAEPGTQETQEVAPGQDGCKSEVPEIEHPAGNLSDFSDAWDCLAEDSSVGSFPGSGPSVQAAHSASMSQKMPALDSVKRAPNWSRGEVLDLIAIWGEMRRAIAAAAKGTKGTRQNQAVCERIAAQMVARGHQRDWLQVRTKIKSLKSLYVRGRDANRMPGAAKNTIPFHKEIADILERDHAVASHHTVQCTVLGPVCCDQQEGDSGEAASSQQPSSAHQRSCEDLVSSMALILSPIAEPGTQETQEVAPGQDGCKSEVPEIEHPVGNLFGNHTGERGLCI